MRTPEQIGRENAAACWDQSDSYPSILEAYLAYAQNVRDTAAEAKVDDTTAQLAFAAEFRRLSGKSF